MPRPRLHRKALTVDQLKQEAKAPGPKDRFFWDTEHGLAAKITPKGAVVFILQKSVRGRGLKRITIGRLGDVTLDEARIRARQLNGIIAGGRDPVAEEKAKREATALQERLEKTVQDLWDRYEVEVLVQNRPSTAVQKRRMWKARIKPAIGKLKIKDVTGTDASEIVWAPVQMDKAGRIRRGKGEAGNLYRLLRNLFNKAIIWKLRPRELGNPLEEVSQPKLERRSLKIGGRAIGALLQAADECGEKGMKPQLVAIIKAAVLTGCRISELRTLRWTNIHADELELRWQNTKTGVSTRSISKEALAVFQSMTRVPGSPYVFRALENPKLPLPYPTVRHAFEKVAETAGVQNCSLHTLRHFFTTTAANTVSNPRVGMKLTGHKSLTAYMGYVHDEKEQADALAVQMGTFFQGLADAPSNVVPAKQKTAS